MVWGRVGEAGGEELDFGGGGEGVEEEEGVFGWFVDAGVGDVGGVGGWEHGCALRYMFFFFGSWGVEMGLLVLVAVLGVGIASLWGWFEGKEGVRFF